MCSFWSRRIIINIAEGKYNPSQIAAFLTVFMMRGISLEELEGFRNALLELCDEVDLSQFNAIDLCGTGGDENQPCSLVSKIHFHGPSRTEKKPAPEW